MKELKEMEIKISNVTEAQAIAIEDMLANWVADGRSGHSEWTSFYADGDGDFRPKIQVNGSPAKHQEVLSPEKMAENMKRHNTEYKPSESDYCIDFDWIAWYL